MSASPEPQTGRTPDIRHEFTNALASVKCLTELLAQYPALERRDRTRLLNILRQETERMVRLSCGLERSATAVGSF